MPSHRSRIVDDGWQVFVASQQHRSTSRPACRLHCESLYQVKSIMLARSQASCSSLPSTPTLQRQVYGIGVSLKAASHESAPQTNHKRRIPRSHAPPSRASVSLSFAFPARSSSNHSTACVSMTLLLKPPAWRPGTSSDKSSKPCLIRLRRFCSDKM